MTRRFTIRFSLRFLLVVVVLLAVLLGIWANRAQKQRRAVERIQALDGRVEYDVPAWSMGLDRILGRDYFADAIRIEFFHYELNHPDYDLPVYFEVEDMERCWRP